MLRGRGGFVLDGVEGTAEKGQSITLPHGDHPHTFWNADPEEDFEVEVRTYSSQSACYVAAYVVHKQCITKVTIGSSRQGQGFTFSQFCSSTWRPNSEVTEPKRIAANNSSLLQDHLSYILTYTGLAAVNALVMLYEWQQRQSCSRLYEHHHPANALQVNIITREGNNTDFAAFLETFFGLSRDFGGPDRVNPLQLLLTFQVQTNIRPSCLWTQCAGSASLTSYACC